MTLFLRAHHALRVAALGSVLVATAWWLAGTSLPVPQLLQGRATPIAVTALLTALYAPLTAYSFGGLTLRFEHGARRGLLAADLCQLVVVCAPVTVVALLAGLTGDGQFAADLTRNVAAFTGVALLLLTIVGEATAVALPVLYFFVTSMLGTHPDGSAQWWAVPRAPATAATLSMAVATLAVGTAVYHRTARATAAARAGRD
ncbi:hypothetical protein ACQEVZ_60130 [Dactylosporangium sp. CA-152071]|uniref:hypothetical protein n=1 Tax=Dactylosporangium sp. CA-152071 TaxID=3239933 RepID=UPI003D8A3539